jgi:hypothetical protein
MQINDHASAEQAELAPENASRDEMDGEPLIADPDGVAGVITALVADYEISLRGQQINDAAFAFVSPLGANYNGCRHVCPPLVGARGAPVFRSDHLRPPRDS